MRCRRATADFLRVARHGGDSFRSIAGGRDHRTWFGTVLVDIGRQARRRHRAADGRRALASIETGGHCRGHLCLHDASAHC